MNRDLLFFILSTLPFLFFAFLIAKVNLKKEERHQQYLMPIFALLFVVVMMIFQEKISEMIMQILNQIADYYEQNNELETAESLRAFYEEWGAYLVAMLYSTFGMGLYTVFKRIITFIQGFMKVNPKSWIGTIVDLFFIYDEESSSWYIRKHIGQAHTYIRAIYFTTIVLALILHVVSDVMYQMQMLTTPFIPLYAIVLIGEIAFYLEGIEKEDYDADITLQAEKSLHIAMYPLLRKPLKTLFGDKLSAEGTTVNNVGITGGGVEDILVNIENEKTHIGKNYALFIRKKMADGLKPNVDYVRSGYELAMGNSLLFNTPFYDKLNPYVFYAMNRALLTGGKVLIVLGRHGTEDDLYQWCEKGMQSVSNIVNYWNIEVLNEKVLDEDETPDIGIISRSSVHDLDLQKNNLAFLKNVTFVLIVEPSRLVTTAQLGLNLLIKNCGVDHKITFCSIDQNCDGLVDALSHILMTNITEVSATEYPHGTSSFMYWTADDEYLQHRILPGVSRCLGMGTELSIVALKNQVKKTIWYGGDAYPVRDARWIAKQYYYDLLDYAQLPTTQETFDSYFQTSFNMCNETVKDNSYITVEDDRNNLFEVRRNFATMAQQQGFVNVISSEYMLREYMSTNTELFTADAKAIPYITADYARTKRNVILTLCLLLCVDSVKEDVLSRQISMLNLDIEDAISELWKEICVIFTESNQNEVDVYGTPLLLMKSVDGKQYHFSKSETIQFKRVYSVESGKFESVYTIENPTFKRIILDDLQNASYIAEQDSKDIYIGSELKGHVYQKYMPGQFFTLNGKYYEMISTTQGDRILVRRAADHIEGRLAYRQIRNYVIQHLEDSEAMGELKSVNNIDIHYQYADFYVETPGYWKLNAYNNFDDGTLVTVNGVPTRTYHHKQILKFDFSKFEDDFTDEIRMTLTALMNEVFVTLFAENHSFISAITPGEFEAPLTYSLSFDECVSQNEKCIYIIEDSQLDLGLLIAVERNINRIFQIIADYLNWNEEQIVESIAKEVEEVEQMIPPKFDVYELSEEEKRLAQLGLFGRIKEWIKKLFRQLKRKKAKKEEEDKIEPVQDEENTQSEVSDQTEVNSQDGVNSQTEVDPQNELIDNASNEPEASIDVPQEPCTEEQVEEEMLVLEEMPKEENSNLDDGSLEVEENEIMIETTENEVNEDD